MPFQLKTDARDPQGFLDPRYTCDAGPPYALFLEDPDARSGIFTHWLIYQIPKTLHHLPAGIPPQESLPNGIRQGVNDFGKLGYGSPCPPRGDAPHRYIFKLYSLDFVPPHIARCTRDELFAVMGTHILAIAELTAFYREMASRLSKAG